MLAVSACVVDAAVEGMFSAPMDDPPRVAALASAPVDKTPPVPSSTLSFPTRAPIPHLEPPVPMSTPTTTTAPEVSTTASPLPSTSATQPPSTPSTSVPPPALGDPPEAVAARIRGSRLAVWNSPGDPTAALALSATTEWGNPRVLLTTGFQGEWVQVSLPTYPNRSEGWVRNRDVQLVAVDQRVDVDLAARTLRWWRGNELVLETQVGVGAPDSPTPPATYFVTDVLPETSPGPYGAWVLALNGYSEALRSFDGKLPRLAIHGTNDPSSIGRAASNGCVRVDAAPLAELAAGVAPGTPVVVH